MVVASEQVKTVHALDCSATVTGLLYNTYLKNKSCKRRFHHTYPGFRLPTSSVIFKPLKILHSTGSVLNKKYTRKNGVPTEEKLEEIEARLENSLYKSMA
jgi:hypothetical protein